MAVVIAVANPRQGIGKSIMALNLAASLALAEKRVLLVVADPRHTLTLPNTSRSTLYEVLRDNVPLGSAIVPAAVPQLEVVPASPALWRLDAELLWVRERELLMRHALQQVNDMYDVVLIDCPSALDLLTINALLAADRVVVPVSAATSLCVEAEQLLQVVASVRHTLRPALQGVQIVVNKASKGATRGGQVQHLVATQIPASTDIATAAALGMPAVLHAADGAGAVAFRQLAAELEASFTLAAQARQEQQL